MSISSASAFIDQYFAGKNKLINGDLRYNQRNFTSVTGIGGYHFDRFVTQASTGSTTTAQTFTPGTAPVAGYEAINYVQVTSSGQSATTDYTQIAQKVEDVRTLAGQTWTYSFWAKASTGTPQLAITLEQVFGTGGTPSANVQTPFGNVTLSTSWQRYSLTGFVPSIAGKTLGTNNDHFTQTDTFLSLGSNYSAYGTLGVQNITVSFWGFQLEAGTTATAFTTATGNYANEFQACQRYYHRNIANGQYVAFALGQAKSTTVAVFPYQLPVPMRAYPSLESGGTFAVDYGGAGITVTVAASSTFSGNTRMYMIDATGTGLTQFRPYILENLTDATTYLGFNAEL
jgi:hypothetical protein